MEIVHSYYTLLLLMMLSPMMMTTFLPMIIMMTMMVMMMMLPIYDSLGNLTNHQYGKRATTTYARAQTTAVGFKIESLPKLRDVKGRDGKTTLMNYLVEVLWGIPEILRLGEDFRELQELRQWKIKDFSDQIHEVEERIRMLQSWKKRPPPPNLESVLMTAQPTPHDGGSDGTSSTGTTTPMFSPLQPLFDQPQHLVPFQHVQAHSIRPTIQTIRDRLLEVKYAWHSMWIENFETAIYFGENPDDLEPPNTSFLEERIARDSSFLGPASHPGPTPHPPHPQVIAAAQTSAATTMSQVSLWSAAPLPGLSTGDDATTTKGKRPEEIFGLFDIFFGYFNEAVRQKNRQREREQKDRERQRKQEERELQQLEQKEKVKKQQEADDHQADARKTD